MPNVDPGAAAVATVMEDATRGRDRRVAVTSLGDRRYWGLMLLADAMLGNSSSALIEAPILGLPAVNVGDRQLGRIRGSNVVDAPQGSADAIEEALRTVLDPTAGAPFRDVSSPFGDGHSAERILSILTGWTPPDPPRKPAVAAAGVGA